MSNLHEFNFVHIPYQEKVYNECKLTLIDGEYIFKELYKHYNCDGNYNVSYLTNFGNIIVGTNYPVNSRIIIKSLITNDNKPYTEKVLKYLKNIKFKSTYYDDLKKELSHMEVI